MPLTRRVELELQLKSINSCLDLGIPPKEAAELNKRRREIERELARSTAAAVIKGDRQKRIERVLEDCSISGPFDRRQTAKAILELFEGEL